MVNSTHCFSCPTSFYGLERGQNSCLPCPSGSATLSSGSNRLSDCVCGEGYFGTPWDSRSSICRPCASIKGIECPINSSWPYVYAGYFRQIESDGEHIVFECIPLEACSETGMSNVTVCSNGYWGYRCGRCFPGRSRVGNQCIVCTSNWLSSSIFSVIILVGLAWIVRNLIRSRTLSRSDSKILVSCLQTIAVFSRLSDKWSGSTQRLLTVASLSVKISHCLVFRLTVPIEFESGHFISTVLLGC